MRVREITSPDDPGLVDFSGLTDVALRSASESAQGLFVAEGAKVIRRALAAGIPPRRVLTEPKWWPELRPELERFEVEVLLAGPELLREVTGYRVHRGALAAMQRPALPSAADVLAGARVVAVLVDLVDHTNVGAIFRTAAALGVDAILLSRSCADPLYRRSVKVSMGAVFALPWAYAGPADGLVGELAGSGWQTLALSPRGEVDLHEVRPGQRLAVLIGAEGPGLPDAVLAAADIRVGIRMHHGVDSLNVAAAAAIALHALVPPSSPQSLGKAPRGDS